MSDLLHWNRLQLGNIVIPEGQVSHGEYVRMVMNYPCQYAFMQQLFLLSEESRNSSSEMWLESNGEKYYAGTAEFSSRIGSMIRQRGLIANLTLRENLLLPFLYHGDKHRLDQATDEAAEVAERLGIASALDEKAGERTTYTHALMSLARCMLAKPAIIVAQEVHIGMPPDHLQRFRELSTQTLAELGSGLLYLTSSADEGSGLSYARTLTIEADSRSLDSDKENR
ncbi:hypothetical protein Ga0123462_1982 [Mariprofundus ferrinatatus]|uniref:ABC transporter n=1 Tax=Mariprofundus ferrinatatus TaxID=1921087 RepID=A0A2K8L983_9PROT|nr:hypothetical protein [Mariprofundus ferrinatatus]ATX82819.1 hypothetical protein Ga0123462_1982 [Mariprofundus ferrinatatus]